MRILQLVSSLGIGGAERFVTDLCVELVNTGHEVTLLVLDRAANIGKSSTYESKLLSYLKSKNVTVFFVEGSGRKNPFNVYSNLAATIKKSKPDVIHSHLLIWSIYLSAVNKKTKHVFTQHTDRLKAPALHKLLRHQINSYISICDQATEKFETVIKKDKIHQVANGINIDNFLNSKKITIEDKVKFVTVSRLSSEKNHNLIIDAVNQLVLSEIYNFQVNIVGQGELERQLKNKVEQLKLSKYIVFHGTRTDIPDILASNHVFLLPSKNEGFSISLIEALASDIKIIASDVGGNSEILDYGKFGCLIPADDLHALVDAMKEEIKTNAIDKRIPDKLAEHLKGLSIETSAKKHLEIYTL